MFFALPFLYLVNGNEFEKCGTSFLFDGVVLDGNETRRGELPFLCALYSYELEKFFCGGALITSRHVLSGKIKLYRKRNNKKSKSSTIF